MANSKITVVKVDPYHKIGRWFIPALVQRLADEAKVAGDTTIVPQFMARLYAGDPGVILVAAVDEKGEVRGHTAAMANNGVAVTIQPKMDQPAANDAIGDMLRLVEEWASALGLPDLMLITRREDPKWLKKYGFETRQYVMVKSLRPQVEASTSSPSTH